MRWCLFICLCLSMPAAAQDTQDIDAITRAETAIKNKVETLNAQRATIRSDISALKSELSLTARELRQIQSKYDALQKKITNLQNRVDALRTKIQADRQAHAELLAALQQLNANPPPALLLSPREAARAAQRAQLLTTLRSKLTVRVQSLTSQLTQLQETEAQIRHEQDALARTHTRLDRRRQDVQSGLSSKAKLEAKIADERGAAAKEAEKLATQSQNIRDLIASLSRDSTAVLPRLKPDITPPQTNPSSGASGKSAFAKAKGHAIRPVAGKILRKFGSGEKGVTYSGQKHAQVLSPYSGKIEFSGPFKNYGRVVIINVGGGYFWLLTGLGDLFVGAGDPVERGEPIGRLPGSSKPDLYIELRRNGATQDPTPWFQPKNVQAG